jgi:hypothetical protein
MSKLTAEYLLDDLCLGGRECDLSESTVAFGDEKALLWSSIEELAFFDLAPYGICIIGLRSKL